MTASYIISTAPQWYWVRFENSNPDVKGADPHLVCDSLLTELLEDMRDRGCPHSSVERVEPRTLISFDLPGSVYADRPTEEFELFGLRFVIPSEDIAPIADTLEKLPRRLFANGKHYRKLHGFWRCLTLTPPQGVELIGVLAKMVAAAEARSKAFYATKKSLSDMLHEANAKAMGAAVEEVPKFEHRTDRFKGRGES